MNCAAGELLIDLREKELWRVKEQSGGHYNLEPTHIEQTGRRVPVDDVEKHFKRAALSGDAERCLRQAAASTARGVRCGGISTYTLDGRPVDEMVVHELQSCGMLEFIPTDGSAHAVQPVSRAGLQWLALGHREPPPFATHTE